MIERTAIPCSDYNCRRFVFFEGTVPKRICGYTCPVCISEQATWSLLDRRYESGADVDCSYSGRLTPFKRPSLKEIRDAINTHLALSVSYPKGKEWVPIAELTNAPQSPLATELAAAEKANAAGFEAGCCSKDRLPPRREP